MMRRELLQKIDDPRQVWDMIVIGGGATGLGTAVDAAARGYRTLLLERYDFASGTSSRSTKLIHGGVRYLQQGNLALVLEALHERGLLVRNAPHLVHNLSFVVPLYDWWEGPFYGIGLKLYDMLAGKLGLGPSQLLSREETLRKIAGTAKGSIVAFDYFTSEVLESKVLYMRTVRASLNSFGEPLRFGIDSTPPSREHLAELLQSCGLTLIEQRTLGQETGGKRAWGGFAIASVK